MICIHIWGKSRHEYSLIVPPLPTLWLLASKTQYISANQTKPYNKDERSGKLIRCNHANSRTSNISQCIRSKHSAALFRLAELKLINSGKIDLLNFLSYKEKLSSTGKLHDKPWPKILLCWIPTLLLYCQYHAIFLSSSIFM